MLITIDEFLKHTKCIVLHHPRKLNWIAWMERIARSWIARQRRIVCLVDWRRLAAFDYVTAALKHTQTVGLYMAKLIGSLPSSRAKGISIVGHSLGAHVAGYCGNALNGSIRLIYGNNHEFGFRNILQVSYSFFSVHANRSRSSRAIFYVSHSGKS